LVLTDYIFLLFAFIIPVLVTFLLIYTNYDFNHIPPSTYIEWTGLDAFTTMFSINTYRETFTSVFIWTIIWTLSATTLQIALVIFTAMVMNQPFIKFKRIFGVILLLPWAVPAFITILTFSNMFNPSAG